MFQEFFFFQIQNCLFFLDSKYFYEMAFCWRVVITSYNNAVLYKLNTIIKSKLKVNWRKALKPLADAALHIFFLKTPPIRLGFVQPYLLYFLWSRLVVDSCWFVLICVGLVLICVDSCCTRVDSCWLVSDLCWFVSVSCWFVLTCVDSCWLVLTRVDTRVLE